MQSADEVAALLALAFPAKQAPDKEKDKDNDKENKPAVATPAYAQWRRYMEESHLCYERTPRVHICANTPDECRVTIDVQARLYGCTVCGRTHACVPPHKHCMRRMASDGSSLVCVFSGRVTDGAVAVPGSYDNEREAADAIRRGPSGESNPLGAGAVGLPRNATARQSQQLRQRANLMGSASMVQRGQLYDQAAALDTLRHGAYEATAYNRTHRGQTTASNKAGPSSSSSSSSASVAEAAVDHGTYMSNYMSASSLPAEWHDPGDDGDDADQAGAAPGHSAWTLNEQYVAGTDAMDMEILEPQTLLDDTFLDGYLSPVLDVIQSAWPVAAHVPPRQSSSTSAISATLMLSSSSTSEENDNSSILSRTWQWPWPPLTADLAEDSAKQYRLPHQTTLLQRAQHWIGAGGGSSRDSARVTRCAIMADRLLVIHAWLQGQRSATQAMGQGKAGWVARVDLVLLRVLGNDFYMRDASGLQLPIWHADPTLAAAAARTPNSARATGFLAALRRAPFSPVFFAHLVHDGFLDS